LPDGSASTRPATLVAPAGAGALVVDRAGRVRVDAPRVGFEAGCRAWSKAIDALLEGAAGSYRGKIVYVNDRMARARDGLGLWARPCASGSRGAVEAARRGAVAVLLIRSAGTDSHQVRPHGQHARRRGRPENSLRPPFRRPTPTSSSVLPPRAGARVAVRLDLQHDPAIPKPRPPTSSARSRGTETRRGDRLAHGRASRFSWDKGTGRHRRTAAAGVAMAIAAAVRAAGPGRKPKRTIRVVLYGAEEFGGDGGEDHA
jgi:hypothetical protein